VFAMVVNRRSRPGGSSRDPRGRAHRLGQLEGTGSGRMALRYCVVHRQHAALQVGTLKRVLGLGPLKAQRRPPSQLWTGGESVAVVTTEALGFADGSDSDRTRWLHAFRRMLDGLDTQLQVVIEVDPGPTKRSRPRRHIRATSTRCVGTIFGSPISWPSCERHAAELSPS